MKPSIGRVVHFHEEGGPYAATITKVNADGTVELVTFGTNSVYFQHKVEQVDEGEPATVINGMGEEVVNPRLKGRWQRPPLV